MICLNFIFHTHFYVFFFMISLSYIHGKRMVHLDVKPENILETETGEFKLSDFGLALPLTGPNSPQGRGVLEFEGSLSLLI